MKTATKSKVVYSLAAITALCILLGGAQAQTETILLSLGTTAGVYYPEGVVADGAGNYYSPTGSGAGFLARFSPSSSGWQAKVIHNFGGGNAGAPPSNSLAFDAAGNLYGTTLSGGTSTTCPTTGCAGSVYKLAAQTDGTWKLSVVRVFTGQTDGGAPFALVFDPAGNLYGMTQGGGKFGGGTVFRLSPKAGGGWTFAVLHSFSGKDGFGPQGNLLVDGAGNLYGSTLFGGNINICKQYSSGGCGVVFRLSPNGTGVAGYSLSLVHRFNNGPDGAVPNSNLLFDAAGNLYGSTVHYHGNVSSNVFMLTPTAAVPWTFTTIYENTIRSNGVGVGVLGRDSAGNLYATTTLGGDPACNCGTVFELSPGVGGWTFDSLHTFKGQPSDGNLPSGLAVEPSGDLLGVTFQGGKVGSGTLFEITP